MSFDKAIKHNKEHRKPYRGAKAVDKHCRNHGDCPYCRRNRLHQQIKAEESADEQLKECNVLNAADSLSSIGMELLEESVTDQSQLPSSKDSSL